MSWAGDETVINEVKLAGGFATGYKLAGLSLTYLNDPSRIVCKGSFEVRTCAGGAALALDAQRMPARARA